MWAISLISGAIVSNEIAKGGELLNLASLPVIESALLEMPQVSCDVIHRFGPGVYIREVTIPAGTFAIGHRQNFEHCNVLLKGRVLIVRDDGGVSELAAPLFFVGKPGRKMGYVCEDMVWLNIYSTNETDVEKLESELITKSAEFSEKELSSIDSLSKSVDVADYNKVLNEFGFIEAQARAQSENASDLTGFPYGSYKLKVAKSEIEGVGLFATGNIEAGEMIAPARIDGKRTPAGRFTNHSANPNATMVKAGDNINLVAIKPIRGCHGGFNGEEITICYRSALKLTLNFEQGV